MAFTLKEDDFALAGRDMKRVVEPATFLLQVGAASNDIRLTNKVDVK